MATGASADDPADSGNSPTQAGAPVEKRGARIEGYRQNEREKNNQRNGEFFHFHLTLLIDAQAISKISAATPDTSSPSCIRFLTSRYFRRPSPLSPDLSTVRSMFVSESRTQ